ncbi:MAG: fatty acyl-CoA reductase, partial [Thermoanaerobaculia bacterium]|nr:fatty acyl-CoA reductase [Thermoanaerobaculia bacterium]
MRPTVDIAGALAGQRILITGATGFLGKVLVEKLLWSAPRVRRLLLLVRPEQGRSAAERLRDEIVGSPIMARLEARHGVDWPEWVRSRVAVVEGDLGSDGLGLTAGRREELCGAVDRVVSAAATVRFDERLDRALEVNTWGALRALELARRAGAPLVQVSTCYVSGRSAGRIAERLHPAAVAPGVDGDPEAVLAALAERVEELRAAPAAGDPGAEERRWVESGRRLARRYGFADVYSLTKWLAEGVLARRRGDLPLTLVRPAVVEGALQEPIPGWIETVRVADPLLLAYGRGRVRRLPGRPEQEMDLVPVDLVVNALAAALAEPEPGDDGLRIYQVSSSRNPVTLGELVEHSAYAFRERPLPGRRGAPGRPRFTEPAAVRRRLVRRRRLLRRAARLARTWGRAGALVRWSARKRRLDHFLRVLEVYAPYLEHPARYDDSATCDLLDRLTPSARATFPFDV